MPEKNSRPPILQRAQRLSEQVASYLSDAIGKGELKPGEKLPSENALAVEFGVSRTVIREAMASLKRDGVLESRHGIGANVAEVGRQQAFRLDGLDQAGDADIWHLFELRAILEGDAAALAAERGAPGQLKQMKDCLQQMITAARDGGDGTEPDVMFHQVMAEASGNPYLRDFMRFLSEKLRGLIRKARNHSRRQPGLPMLVENEHQAIYEAIAGQDASEARQAALTHVRNAAERLGLHQS
jgi:GntR family transcriptional regulator, transcriptional repressor for pyruvate dehydrogenase complex